MFSAKGWRRSSSAAVPAPSFPTIPDPSYHVGGGGRFGYINPDGKYAINPQFEDAGTFQRRARAGQDGAIGVSWIRPGKLSLTRSLKRRSRFPKGSRRSESGGKWGFVDKTGKIDHQCAVRRRRVLLSKAWRRSGRANTGVTLTPTGKFAINPQFDDAAEFSDGLAPVKQGKHWGFIDPTGKFAINPQFDEAESVC